jgi:hypothetical protein
MSTSIVKSNKPTRKDKLRLIVSGVQKHFPSGQMSLAGQTFNVPTDLVNLLQADINATDATDKARAAWLATVQTQTDSHAKVAPVLRSLKAQVFAQFGDTQDAATTLADFGYSPRKVRARSADKKAAAAVKGRATRAARHTMGSKQKQAVTGNVTGVVVTPLVSAPATPAVATASPAPAPVTAAAPAPATNGAASPPAHS